MRKIYPILATIVCCYINFAQIGINTINPTADLDVNGTTRIRTLPINTVAAVAKDSILVADGKGNVKITSSKQIYESNIKTFVKGNFNSTNPSLITLNLLANTVKILFDQVQFDTNLEFNATNNTFTPKQDGIYEVAVQIKASAGVNVAIDFGVAVLKNNIVINQNSFANVGVVVTNVTPPVRYVSTLLSLTTTDSVQFNVTGSLVSLSLLKNSEDCFFTIKQIR